MVAFDIIGLDILIEPPPLPPEGFPTYYVPSARTVSTRTPLEEFVPFQGGGVLSMNRSRHIISKATTHLTFEKCQQGSTSLREIVAQSQLAS